MQAEVPWGDILRPPSTSGNPPYPFCCFSVASLMLNFGTCVHGPGDIMVVINKVKLLYIP